MERRLQSSSRIIVLVWSNDQGSPRTVGSRTDAYGVFAMMPDASNAPDDWSELLAAASNGAQTQPLATVARRPRRKPG
jgi:toxin YhaV